MANLISRIVYAPSLADPPPPALCVSGFGMASPKDDARFKYISKIVATQLSSTTQTVTPAMVDKGTNASHVEEFFAKAEAGVEPRMALLFYHQKVAGSAEPVVFSTDGAETALTGKCCYALRLTPPSDSLPNDVEANVNFGTLSASANPMATLGALADELFSPLISANSFGYAKKMSKEHQAHFTASTRDFCTQVQKSLEALDMAMT